MTHYADNIWACDFLPVTDLPFRPHSTFVLIALRWRRVVHVGVTRHPERTTHGRGKLVYWRHIG